ncbi:22461_t:CDS:2 [Dentiscutata erythropus]|uniref:22461_t:CDS:1 n=1 Tax=Dentiscutata erythropus TaxID=1348616 RepID=A0A9N9J0M5_9GLOM|nr:22461_t:CDS:2 [Dentiscutata erythropus]
MFLVELAGKKEKLDSYPGEDVLVWEHSCPGTSVQVPQNLEITVPKVPIRSEISVPPEIPPLQKLWFKFKWNPRVFSVVVSSFITIFAAIGIDLIVSLYTGGQKRKEI